MKKAKLLFLNLMLGIGFNASGQITLYDDTTSLPNEDLPPHILVSDGKATDTLPTKIYQGQVPQVLAYSKVYYSSAIVVYFKFENYLCAGCQMRLLNSNGVITQTLIPNGKGEVILETLEPETRYELSFFNNLSDNVPFFEFSTNRSLSWGTVYSSQAFYDSISNWMIVSPNESLISYFERQNTFHNLEKLSYIQQSFGSISHVFPITMLPGFILPSQNDYPTLSNCNCRFNLIIPAIREDGAGPATNVNGELWPPNDKPSNYWTDFRAEDNGIRRDEWWYDQVHQGPSRRERTELEGRERGGIDWDWSPGGGINKPSQDLSFWARRSIAWRCYDINYIPDNCGCNQSVNFQYSYSASLKAFAETKRALSLKKRSAYSQVEDAALVLVTYETSQRKTVANGNRVLAYANAESEHKPKFYLELAKIVGDSAIIRAKVIKGIPQPGLGDSLVGLAETILNAPTFRIPINGFSGGLELSLPPNDPLTVHLLANSQHTHRGRISFRSTTELASNFRLSMRYTRTEGDDFCCAPSVGSWILSTQQGFAPRNYANLKGEVASHLILGGGWHHAPVIEIDYGAIQGPMPQGCQTVVQVQAPYENSGSIYLKEKSIYFGMNIDSEKQSSSNSFIIMNTLGQIILSGTTDANGFIANQQDLPSNETLIIKVNTPAGEVIKKLYKLQP